MNPKLGTSYLIDHSRKGRFVGKVVSCDEEWATVEVKSGIAFNMASPDIGPGEKVTVRISHARWTERK